MHVKYLPNKVGRREGVGVGVGVGVRAGVEVSERVGVVVAVAVVTHNKIVGRKNYLSQNGCVKLTAMMANQFKQEQVRAIKE